jgi:hypothetical protein
MKNIKNSLLICFIFLILPIISASLDYSISVNSLSSVNIYEGNIIQNQFSITITNNAGTTFGCDISCDYVTTMNTVGSGLKAPRGEIPKTYFFEIKAEGNQGVAYYGGTITCDRIATSGVPFCLPDKTTKSFGQYSFTFLWNGDGICTTSNEKCDNYYDGSNNFLKDIACFCSSEKECRPDSIRGSDSFGCATFCGNGISEEDFETCSNCPSDVGKCDGLDCISDDECENKYCVHETCWNRPYRESDGFCDKDKQENCKNSKDCSCLKNEICNNEGICGKTEASEKEVKEAIKTGIQETLQSSQEKTKYITFFSIGLIVIFIVVYLIYKRKKDKKEKQLSKRKSEEKKNTKKRKKKK